MVRARGRDARLGTGTDALGGLVSCRRDADFERYLAAVPGLGAPRVLQLPLGAGALGTLCAACAADTDAVGALNAAARRAAAFNLEPFRSGGQVWPLARRIAVAASGTASETLATAAAEALGATPDAA